MSEPAPGVAIGVSRLAATLRAGGVRVGVAQIVAGVRALDAIDVMRREDAWLALRAVMCSRHEDLAVFDAAFGEVFVAPGDRWAPPCRAAPPAAHGAVRHVPSAGTNGDVPGGDDAAAVMTWSDVALDRHKSFGQYTDEERAAVQRVLDELARRTPKRRSRRTRPTRRRQGHVPDLRRTIRGSLAHVGEPIERHWRAPTERPRPLVLVVDVSGSMEPYARVLLQFAQACVTARRRVEAFAFGTRLTRITSELARRDPDRALARAADAVSDWSGGTRIGESLATLNREHGRRLGRGAAVLILSDGWDRGDPELVGVEMARLERTAHRVVWLNPLAAQPGFEPLARGMQAALPHTAHMLPGNSLASLEDLALLLEGL